MSFIFNIATPPATHDLRPERPDRVYTRLERLVHRAHGALRKVFAGRRELRRLVSEIENQAPHYKAMDNVQLQQAVDRLHRNLLSEGLTAENLVTSFGLIREMGDRVLGTRHYACQLSGGLVLLKGMAAEMETGEGKTLTATLPAATAAMAGIPVHVISVNDYLTARDAQNMGPLYQALGLSVGCVVHGKTPAQRRQAYLCDITYVTNKELVFDYLRDRLTLSELFDPIRLQTEYLYGRQNRSKRLLLRGLHFAIVDEMDCILIDEARTPLIISGASGGDEERQFLEQALDIAADLIETEDYVLDTVRRQVRLTEVGKKRIESAAKQLGPLWNGMVRRASIVCQALTAMHFFHRDEQYLLRDGKIQIIDEFTGRVMEDRSWEQGLHQLIEVKERCDLSQRNETLAKISYQRFFRRYLRLSGMTGTAREVADEIWFVYHLHTLKIATHRPLNRKKMPHRVFLTKKQKWQAVVDRIQVLNRCGRPVLIGTRSVAASEHLSALVQQDGLAHQVLNAKQDAEEAGIISRAGVAGTITIATNMAGRGTDILLGEGVKGSGGLHVIATECHEAARIDRQLAGRCGRQGDPGSHEAILSLEDLLLDGKRGGVLAQTAKRASAAAPLFGGVLGRWAIRRAQKKIEAYHARIRKRLFFQDQAQGSLLSFSGRLE